MTEIEFRFKYSELIQFYQYIEERLKYICSHLLANEGKDWFNNLLDIECDPFGMLIKKIEQLQEEKQIFILSDNDIKDLKDLKETRNYWVHQCFGGITTSPVIFKKEELKNPYHGTKLITDLNVAIEWEDRLVERLRENKGLL